MCTGKSLEPRPAKYLRYPGGTDHFQVCRLFARLVRTDIRAQLIIEMRCAAMIEGPPGNESAGDRLNNLRAYMARFRQQSAFIRSHNICGDAAYRSSFQRSFDGSICYFLSNTVDRSDTHFVVKTPPSALRGTEALEWTVPVASLVASWRDFCEGTVDVAQDLIAIAVHAYGTW